MIKLFRNIRQNLLNEGKTTKYFKYAIGEIVLVVIGILIALQLNNWNENKNKTKIGYQYLAEMKAELQDDVLKLDKFITILNKNIENQQSALKAKDIAKLPIDSLTMIVTPINLDFKMNELTFNKMNNLGITSLSNNDSLNSKILKYYNSDVVNLKLSMSFIFNEYIKYIDYQLYEQDKIDIPYTYSNIREFPSLYQQSKEEDEKEQKQNLLDFIYSIKGRNLVLINLENIKYSLRVFKSMQGKTANLLKSIYDELKVYDPQIEPLPKLPLSAID